MKDIQFTEEIGPGKFLACPKCGSQYVHTEAPHIEFDSVLVAHWCETCSRDKDADNSWRFFIEFCNKSGNVSLGTTEGFRTVGYKVTSK